MQPLMKPQLCVRSDNATDDYIQYLRQMNLSHCFVMFSNEHSNYEDVNRILDKLRRAGLTVDDAGNGFLYKHMSIHLGLADRDRWIDQYNDLNKILGQAGVPVGYVGNSRVSHTGYFASEATHGALGRTVDMEEILRRPPVCDPIVEEDALWENFRYLLERALPVAKENGMQLALHPSDPPYPMYEGYASLIHSGDCFRKALKMADEIVPGVLGIKFCCGCWLEGGKAFGDILADLREFVRARRVLTVHFRNVSCPLPHFTETLAEDGYFDMMSIMRVLVEEGYDQAIYPDHIFQTSEKSGGDLAQFAYAIGYMKGLMNAAYSEIEAK
ncbi:MAG: mannonate dehydratase [Clostridia bacterium]|nr:mannonate dehydratase [Clostridia bacterium]